MMISACPSTGAVDATFDFSDPAPAAGTGAAESGREAVRPKQNHQAGINRRNKRVFMAQKVAPESIILPPGGTKIPANSLSLNMLETALSPPAFFLLACAGFAGGLIDAIAGGGGLITVPALLAAGLPPQMALGTNKMQSACGTLLAVIRYGRAGLLRSPGIPLAVGCSFVAGAAGAWAVSVAPPDLLRRIIPWLLAAVAVYTMVNRRFGQEPRPAVISAGSFALAGGLVLGFYDGLFGPGAGSFWTVGLVSLLGLDLRHATGFTKTVNLASNLGALILFAAHGAVHLPIAAAMIAGQLLGARLGSGLVIRKGATLIRPVFLAVVLALTFKLLLDAWRN